MEALYAIKFVNKPIQELNMVDTGSIFYELARWDSSIATFMIV